MKGTLYEKHDIVLPARKRNEICKYVFAEACNNSSFVNYSYPLIFCHLLLASGACGTVHRAVAEATCGGCFCFSKGSCVSLPPQNHFL